jgi:hypothetical protein
LKSIEHKFKVIEIKLKVNESIESKLKVNWYYIEIKLKNEIKLKSIEIN